MNNRINLYAFWHYDLFPFVCGAVASRMDEDGRVYVEDYQGWVKPIKLLPIKVGEELHCNLETLRSQYQKAQNELNKTWKVKAKKYADFIK